MNKETLINSRSSGLVDNLSDYNFHILGCGAIGSAAATQLARMGAFNFCLYDNDKVDINNIGVSQYTLYDIGYPKVDSLKSKILDINDRCEIMCANEMFKNYCNNLSNSKDVTVGFCAVILACALSNNVSIYGFNFFREKNWGNKHYFEKITPYQQGHNFEHEAEYFNELKKQNYIKIKT